MKKINPTWIIASCALISLVIVVYTNFFSLNKDSNIEHSESIIKSDSINNLDQTTILNSNSEVKHSNIDYNTGHEVTLNGEKLENRETNNLNKSTTYFEGNNINGDVISNPTGDINIKNTYNTGDTINVEK